jgi:alpha/beta superfamily hydrolase
MSSKLEQALWLKGPAGSLEAKLNLPETSQTAQGIAVVCHPHPQFGGTLDNKVTYMMARGFNDAGIAAVRFNFRGVGKSAGGFDQGIGELEDCMAILDWAKGRWSQLYLAGFSFGAYIALRASQLLRPSLLVSVALPVQYFAADEHPMIDWPWLLLQGDADEVVNIDAVKRWLQALPHQPRMITFPGASHFFHGQVVALRHRLAQEVRDLKSGETA